MRSERLPRKLKKHYFGLKISKNKLNKMIVNKHVPLNNCPYCGSTKKRYYSEDIYPEVYNTTHCKTCGLLLVIQDNGYPESVHYEIELGHYQNRKELQLSNGH